MSDTGITLALAVVREINTEEDMLTGIHHYETMGSLEVVDIASIQGVVGRIWNRDRWAIVD
ncbi:hypothetical protein M422DRAFT_169964 [Sphaerobolus stellatus SS14]|uniref:Uncharacterized protein n=1 Tax=Sphaerobolus stellatus (strain SS14) TaxID=990650 RepID=A0A0C9UK19_SPHS4|nr:hypothetical protein M422DRAFT_169964 [Sphaerobolus stellatus SS14]